MKLPFIPVVITLIKKFKIPLIIVGAIFLLGIGAFFGWKQYQFLQSPEKALQTITLALQKGDRHQLALLVDFRALSEDLARQIQAHYPAAASLPALAVLAENIQQSLWDSMGASADKPVKVNPYAPLEPLPAEALPQIATTLHMQQVTEHFALLQAIVDYPRAEHAFTLLLQLDDKAGQGWRITKVVNAAELVQAFVKAETLIANHKAEALAKKNAEQESRMNAQFTLHSCTARAGMLSDGKTALLTIEILGFNPGPHAIFNFNIEASLNSKTSGGDLFKVPLNLAKRTLQGENFSHSWNIPLDLESPEHQALLREKNLQCTPRFRNMGLGSGEVLFVRKNL